MTLVLDSEQTSMDYTTLTLAEIRTSLDDIAREARATFGHLDAAQLNWRPGGTQWSVAQCFEHLLTTNQLMLSAATDALKPAHARTVWERLPLLPGILGGAMVRSQAPGASRKFVSPPLSTPSASAIADDVIDRFSRERRTASVRLQSLDDREAARTIMTSPFLRFITYSVLDGWRLVTAHDRRHFEQARRVTQASGFPAGSK